MCIAMAMRLAMEQSWAVCRVSAAHPCHGYTYSVQIIHNLKWDEKVMTLRQEWGAVTALSFRTGAFVFGRGGLRVVLRVRGGPYIKRSQRRHGSHGLVGCRRFGSHWARCLVQMSMLCWRRGRVAAL